MATTLHLLILAVLTAGCAHAQYDFCRNGSTRRHLHRDKETSWETVETAYLPVGDERLTRLTDNVHDFVEGNCTGEDVGEPFFINNDCVDPNPFGVAMHGHGYFFADKTITCVKVMDRFEDGDGGFVSINTGGVGGQSIQLIFTSQEYKGLKFYTEVYAKYVPP